MKQILVPCDFSTPAINAFRFALQLASKSGATVHLIHAIELPVILDFTMDSGTTFKGAYMKELSADTLKRFEKLRQEYSVEAKDTPILSTFKFGSIANSILEYAHSAKIDLITMGSHGAHGLHELFMGSNAEKIVRQAHCPVFIIKYHAESLINDIIFPNSFAEENQAGLMREVKALQQFFQAKLHLLHINTPINFSADAMTYARMEKFARQFDLSNYTKNVYNNVDVEEGIVEFSRSITTAIIAIATHGYTGISHLVNGSIAEDLTNHNKNLLWTYSINSELVKAVQVEKKQKLVF